MKTVRLPIYNENGFETGELLEVDLNFFLPANPALKSNMARVLQPQLADWERELLLTSDEVGLIDVVSKYPEEIYEWRLIDDLPIKSFEINRAGVIRHKSTGRIMETEFDIDQSKWRTLLMINGKEYSIDHSQLADKMWSR